MAVPYTFGSATTSIPLSQLDSNFATTITLGNTAVQLGNTITNLTGVSNVASATSLSLGSNGNTTAITVDTSQRVGVNITTPNANFQVNGAIQVTGTPTIGSTGVGVEIGYGLVNASEGAIQAYNRSGSAWINMDYSALAHKFLANNTEAMRIDSSGNVLVGATSPYSGTASNFTATTGVDIGSSSTATSKQLQFIRNGSTGTAGSIYATAGSFSNYCGMDLVIENVGGGSQAGYLKFNTTSGATSAERMRIASDNRVYIACTSAPSATVAGVRLGNPNEALCAFSSGSVTIETYQLGFYNGNGLVGRISTSGSATTYATSSDYRLKETIAPMTGALGKVAQLKPCTYKWKVDGSDGEGFIAHELAEVVPQCVSGEKDAVDADGNPSYQGVDTSFLVATLTAAIQELKAIVDAQATTIAELQAKVA